LLVTGYVSGHEKRDRVVRALVESFKGQFFDSSHTLVGGLSVFMGFDASIDDKILECWAKKLPFLHIDHAYFQRGYEKGNFRVNFNHFHQTAVLDVADSRRPEKLCGSVEPWKKGREILVIEPSSKVEKVLASPNWAQRTADRLRAFTDRPIRIKQKGPGLIGELKDCHAVVSLSSVAEVEAAKYGIPVFATEHSPASPIAEHDFSKIESPTYPEREAWLRSLSYSQWHVSEMANGTTRRVLKDLYGAEYLHRA
jgi:hypothetical protein